MASMRLKKSSETNKPQMAKFAAQIEFQPLQAAAMYNFSIAMADISQDHLYPAIKDLIDGPIAKLKLDTRCYAERCIYDRLSADLQLSLGDPFHGEKLTQHNGHYELQGRQALGSQYTLLVDTLGSKSMAIALIATAFELDHKPFQRCGSCSMQESLTLKGKGKRMSFCMSCLRVYKTQSELAVAERKSSSKPSSSVSNPSSLASNMVDE
jgi:hypothetical protein